MMLKLSEGTSVSCGQTTFRALDSRTARVTVLHIPKYVVPHDVADNQVPAHTEKHVSARQFNVEKRSKPRTRTENPGFTLVTYVGGGLEDGTARFALSRRVGGSGGAPRLKRSALVSARPRARDRTEVRRTKKVRATAASLCIVVRSKEHKRGDALGRLKASFPCS